MESNLLSCGPKQNDEILNNINHTQKKSKLKALLQEEEPVGWNLGKKTLRILLIRKNDMQKKNPSNPYAVLKVDRLINKKIS